MHELFCIRQRAQQGSHRCELIDDDRHADVVVLVFSCFLVISY